MAEVVVPAQVFEQLVVVKVTVVAELAERVTPVAGVVRVSVGPVPSQFLAVVPLALMGEDLMGCRSQVSGRSSKQKAIDRADRTSNIHCC